MAEVVLESVRKVYPGGVLAVDDLTLRVADGEFIVLVGPSGCGKTTTLRLIAGLETLTAGTIRIGDRVVNDVHPKDRDVAMVFQDYALYPHMTVGRNLSFALKLRKTPPDEIERRVARTAELLGIAELLGRRPGALSGGQQQRVALGRAIVRQPRCFLFDEPLSSLDAALRLQMRAEIKTLHQRLKTTTVYVTHDQEEAMTLGDRLVIMTGGVVQQIGGPLDVYQRPANRFVAGFLGSPPMNFIEGSVEDGPHGLAFTDGADLHMPLDGRTATVGKDQVGQQVVLGIRPEKLAPAATPSEQATTGAGFLPARIDVLEPLGDRVDVHATTSSGGAVVARLDATAASYAPGDTVRFRVEAAVVHLFEPGRQGRRL